MKRPQAALALALRFGRDFGAIAAVMVVYFLVRGAAPHRPDFAVDVTLKLVAFERAVFLFHEEGLQEVTLRAEWTKELANALYAYLHFPALAGAGALLWWRDRKRFLHARDTLFISMVLGIVFYYLLPAAPPRLMAAFGHDYGFVDTVFGGGTWVEYAQPGLFVNDLAAIPSFHFGWMLLASAMLWVAAPGLAGRTMAVALCVVMAWASAATANHFFIDMIIGALVVVAAAGLALPWARRRAGAGPGP